jgi:DNA-binding NarL/FixJ family response regulator
MEANDDRVTRIVIVDDSEVVRLKLRELLGGNGPAHGLTLVGEAADGEEGLHVSARQQPDVVVMDLNMPGMSGIEATWQLGSVSPGSKVLVLSVSDDGSDIADAIMAGARGYVVKGASDSELIDAVRKVATGGRAISPQVAAELVERTRSTPEGSPRPETPEPQVESNPQPPAVDDDGSGVTPWIAAAGGVALLALGYALGSAGAL